MFLLKYVAGASVATRHKLGGRANRSERTAKGVVAQLTQTRLVSEQTKVRC